VPKKTLVSLLLGLSIAATAPAVRAAPDTPTSPSDAVMRLLQERGLALEGAPLLEQVRDKASDMVLTAMNFIGVRYKRGGTSEETGFDCSGFTRHIFEKSLGLVLPRRADEQARLSSLIGINRDDLRPGDLVFFNTMRRTFSHVGIYVGDGKFIHSPRTGSHVRVDDMNASYWAKRFNGARRAPENDAGPPPDAPLLPIPVVPLTATAPIQSPQLR